MRAQLEDYARATCPCCGYPTIVGRAMDEICPMCNWEDDGQDDHHRYPGANAEGSADTVWGGVNLDYSLREARENFAAYFTQYRPTDPHFEQDRLETPARRRASEIYDRFIDGDATFDEADALARVALNQIDPVDDDDS